MSTIVQNGDSVLREKALPVPTTDITTSTIQTIIADMQNALSQEKDGVAIAAPQIGKRVRIFIVSNTVVTDPQKPRVFINPELINTSRTKEWLDEGCLSVRWKYGEVKRATKVTVRAYNENGEAFTLGASGLLAQIFQHEIDHLNGILFIDKARKIEDIPPEAQQSTPSQKQ